MKKTIMIDLDGVLNTYNGKYEEMNIPPLREGAWEFIKELSHEYVIEIFTVRNKIATVKWLEENNLIDFIKDVSNVKNPYANVFVDDRAINFDGDFDKIFKQIKKFKPYWK